MNKRHTTIQQIYKGGKEDDILVDLHCWVECGGVEMDYDDEALKACSLYGTNKIVRVPFNKILAAECLPLILAAANAKVGRAIVLGRLEEAEEHWHNNTGHCCCRAVLIWQMLREKGYKAKLKIGSLGFVQKNNKDIFYEYG